MTRRRLPARTARRLILDAAEKELAERGPDGVRVQQVAEQLGIVPATVLHHFGSRDGLLRELMVHGARTLRTRLEELVADARPDLVRLASELVDLYASRGYAALYGALSNTGRLPDEGNVPIFAPLLARLRDARGLRTRSQREQTAYAVLVLNLVAFAQALVGPSMRRGVGLPDDEASRARFSRWLGRLLDEALGAA